MSNQVLINGKVYNKTAQDIAQYASDFLGDYTDFEDYTFENVWVEMEEVAQQQEDQKELNTNLEKKEEEERKEKWKKGKFVIKFEDKLWSKHGGYTAFWDNAKIVSEYTKEADGWYSIKYDETLNLGDRRIDSRNEIISFEDAKVTFRHSDYMETLEEYKVYSKKDYETAFAGMHGYTWHCKSNQHTVANSYCSIGCYNNKAEAEKQLEKEIMEMRGKKDERN